MSSICPVIIDSKLRVAIDDITSPVAIDALRELTLLNPERAEAEAKKRYGAEEIPEWFEMAWTEDGGDTLVMPRGYAHQLKLLLRENGIKVKWIDRRVWSRASPLGKDTFSYRDHQPAAVRALRKHQQGIYKAPTGSGKTVTACGLIWETHPANSLILVDRINLVDQWIDRIEQHIGIPRDEIGRIGEGGWTEGRVTVATVQTLYRRRHELQDAGWFDLWDIVCLDECHHVTAETFMDLFERFSARIRLGMSATPDKTGIFALALNSIGEVVYETTQEELRRLGLLVEPTIKVVPTNFTFAYWGDHESDRKGNCNVPGCKKNVRHRHQNNYAKLKQAVVSDRKRNELIANEIDKRLDTVQLVITDQTTQIEALMDLLIERYGLNTIPIYVLTGKQNGKTRKEIIAKVEEANEPCIILSTIAGEALDIPIISVVHLIFPTRNPRKTEQNVGRGTRSHDDKVDSIIIDYADFQVGVLGKQFGTRRKQCYEPLGFKVEIPEDAGMKREGGLGRLGALR